MITLNEQEVKNLKDYLVELPFKISAPILQFLESKIEKLKEDETVDRDI